MENYDIIIIGSGAGGGTLAYTLADTGKKILIIERGDYLPREKENWDPYALFIAGRYNPDEEWLDKDGNTFRPSTHYYVGGNTKFYGAALLRLREKDFEEVQHYGGVSPAWPLKYKDFQPYYLKAETLYSVHGERGADPTEPKEDSSYPCPPLSHEPRIQEIFDQIKGSGHTPFPLPVGIRLNEKNREKSECIRCDTCDGFPCMVDAKADSHTTCIRKALEHDNVTLKRNIKVTRLITDDSGKKVTEVEGQEEENLYRLKVNSLFFPVERLILQLFYLNQKVINIQMGWLIALVLLAAITCVITTPPSWQFLPKKIPRIFKKPSQSMITILELMIPTILLDISNYWEKLKKKCLKAMLLNLHQNLLWKN